MKLIEYLPSFFKDIREFKQVFQVEDEEIEKLKGQIEKILQEVIVDVSEDYGLQRYEKIYNISNNVMDLSNRRFNILSKINNRLPYSLNWLKNKLNSTIGKENYTLTIDYNKYSMEINVAILFKDIAILLNKDLKEQLPANLQVTINLFQTEQCQQYFTGIVHIGDFIKIRQVG